MEEGWDGGRGGAPKVGAASCIEKGNVYRVESHMWGRMRIWDPEKVRRTLIETVVTKHVSASLQVNQEIRTTYHDAGVVCAIDEGCNNAVSGVLISDNRGALVLLCSCLHNGVVTHTTMQRALFKDRAGWVEVEGLNVAVRRSLSSDCSLVLRKRPH